MKHTYFLYIVILLLFIGCTSVKAVKDSKTGIPFYLPKPYLLVTKNISLGQTKTVTEKKPDGTTITTTEPVFPKEGENPLSFQIVYLPDFTERYGLEVNAGWGSIATNIPLVDGWKCTGINITADSKTSENIQAVGSVVGELGRTISTTLTKMAEGEERVEIKTEAPSVEVGLWLYEIKKDGIKEVFKWTIP